MNLLYCGDRGIEDGVLISALSLAKHVAEPLHIFLLTFNFQNKTRRFLPITEHYRAGLENILKEKNPSHTVSLFDITDLFLSCPPTANQNSRFTPGCMLRLFADSVSALPGRILYLDNDVVALGDPAPFYNLNLDNHELAGVLDNYGQHFFERGFLWRNREYLNSGVLLLNLDKIRQTGLLGKARQLCQTDKMFMPDQTALNKLCHTKLIMPRKYNEQSTTHSDTVFRHFTTTLSLFPFPHPQTIKPWQISPLHDKLKEYSIDDCLAEYKIKIKEVKDA